MLLQHAAKKGFPDTIATIPPEVRVMLDLQKLAEVAPFVLPVLGQCELVNEMIRDGHSSIHYEPEHYNNGEGLSDEDEGNEPNGAHKRDSEPDAQQDEGSRNPDEAAKATRTPLDVSTLSHAQKISLLKGAQYQLDYLPSFVRPSIHQAVPQDHTVSICLPSLQRLLGRDETGTSTFRLDEFGSTIDTSLYTNNLSATSLESSAAPEAPQDAKSTYSMFDTASTILLCALYRLAKPCQHSLFNELHRIKGDTADLGVRYLSPSQFAVGPTLIAKLEAKWSQTFVPTDVQVVPHQLKLMSLPSGQHLPHQDSSDPRLIGSIWVGLSPRSAGANPSVEPHLTICNTGKRNHSRAWDLAQGSYFSFYKNGIEGTRVPTLEPIPQRSRQHSTSPSIFGAIVFNVFSRTQKPTMPEDLRLDESMTRRILAVPRPFGILLNYEFMLNLQRGTLIGSDAVIYDALERIGDTVRLEVMPVMTHFFSRCGPFPRDSSDRPPVAVSSNVYPFNYENVRRCLKFYSGDEEEEPEERKDAPAESRGLAFLQAEGCDAYRLKHRRQNGCEHEYQFSFDRNDTVFLSTAVIIHSAE